MKFSVSCIEMYIAWLQLKQALLLQIQSPIFLNPKLNYREDPQKGQNLNSGSATRSQKRHRKLSGMAGGPVFGGGRENDRGNMRLQLLQYTAGSLAGHFHTGTKKSLRTLSYSTRSAMEPQLMHLPTPDLRTWRTCCSTPPTKKKNIFFPLYVWWCWVWNLGFCLRVFRPYRRGGGRWFTGRFWTYIGGSTTGHASLRMFRIRFFVFLKTT